MLVRGKKLGVFANGFRVIRLDDEHCALDFLLCSTAEQQAKVVQRVKVPPHLLTVMVDYMDLLVTDKDSLSTV
jgi:hypothetical protein